MSEARQRFVVSGDVRINVVEMGPAEGRPVVFLHGFPECWWSWRRQMTAVAAAGYRAVAMDLRGFGDSDRPAGVEHYALPAAFGDVGAVVSSVGGRAAIVSHDWGGVLGWGFAAAVPDAVERLVVLNAPHPNTYAGVHHHLPQLQASWYMFLFQFEGVAEELLSRNGGELLRAWFYDTASVELPEADIQAYLELFSRPGALTAGLNWYRANVPPAALLAEERFTLPPIARPTLLLWGMDDPYLTFDLARHSGEHCTGPFALQTIPDTGHWIQQERPDEVNAHLLDFLGAEF